MAKSFKQWRAQRRAGFTLFAITLIVQAHWVQAQICTPALPDPAAAFSASQDGGKFRLIEHFCPPLTEHAQVDRARQLDLYQRPRSVVIQMDSDKPLSGRSTLDLLPETGLGGGATWTRHPGRDSSRPPNRREVRVMTLAGPIVDLARDNGLDPLLLHAIAHVESRHDPNAVSPAGARGLMQVMPATGERFGAKNDRSLFDPNTNLRASAAYLRTLMLRYHDDLPLVLAAYNAGEGAVDRAGRNIPPFPETRDYVRKVLAAYRRLSREFKISKTGRLQSVSHVRGPNQ